MYARTTSFRAMPGTMDDGITYVRDAVMPVAENARGYVGLSMLVNRELDRGIVATAWATQRCRAASTPQLQPVRDQAGEILGAEMVVEEWDITVLRRHRPAGPGARVCLMRAQLVPAHLSYAVSAFRVAAVPALEGLRGFCSTSLFEEPATGAVVATMSYDGGEDARATRAAAADVLTGWASATAGKVLDVCEYDLVLAHLRVPEMA